MATAVELGVRAKKDPSVQKQLSESGVIPCLVQKLQSPKRECQISAARALALLGESSTDLQLEIIAAGAVPLLSQLTRAGSRKTGEAAGWAMSCLTAARKPSSVESTPDVSVPLLVEMLCNGGPEVQASAVLELNRTLACVFGSCEEVGLPSVVQSLVNLLSYEMPEVHQAAGNLLASLVNKNQAALQNLIETDGIVPQLLHIIQRAGDHGKTAAAQVLKTLAESSEKIQLRITESNGILSLVTLLKVGYPGSGGREAAAWMLGSLACHSSGAGDQLVEQGTASVLEGLVVDGEAQEQIAAAWALHQLQKTDDASSPALSVPLIVRSLESGSREAKVVAAWELCHLASSNFWVQMELLQADAIKSLMALLQEREPEEGMNAALTTLLRLCPDMEVIPKEICQQGGISILLGILKERAAADEKLVMKLLSLLVERCPVHQQEVLSAGTVPFLVKMLNECEGVCVTARDLLMKLVESELTAISLAMCKESVPVLLEIAKSQGEACSKEASVALLSRMVEINVESRQILLNHGGMPVMLDILNGDETYDLKTMAANAMTKLAATNQKVQGRLAGSGAFGALVQLLQSTSTRIRCREAARAAKVSQREEGGGNQEQLELTESRIMKGEREKNEGVLSTVEEKKPLFNSPIVHQTSAIAPQQHSADKALVAALRTIREAAHDYPSDGLEWKSRGLRHFVSSNSQDVPKQLPTSACDNGTSHVPGEKPSAASSTVNHTSEELEEGSAGEECPAISLLVKELRYGQANGREAAAAALKGLAVGNKAKRLELVNAGAVPLLVEILQSRSFH